jgi:hypothetical protein
MAKKVMVCPKCKSTDVYRDSSFKLEGVGLPAMYICGKCNYSGPVFPEVDVEDLEEFEKTVDEQNLRDTNEDKVELVDTRYGNFIVKGWWKIIGPIALLFGFISLFVKFISFSIFLFVLGGVITFISYRERETKK